LVMPPRKRRIPQSAAPVVLRNRRHGVLDRPVEPGDDIGGLFEN
jgi:hypothetical protein